MDRKQKKALKILRNLQKKMDKAVSDHNASEIERLSKEMWEAHNQYGITVSSPPGTWIADWVIVPKSNTIVGCDFERKIK